jgi:hypothetical protein
MPTTNRFPVWMSEGEVKALVAALDLARTVQNKLGGVPEDEIEAWLAELNRLERVLTSATRRANRGSVRAQR